MRAATAIAVVGIARRTGDLTAALDTLREVQIPRRRHPEAGVWSGGSCAWPGSPVGGAPGRRSRRMAAVPAAEPQHELTRRLVGHMHDVLATRAVRRRLRRGRAALGGRTRRAAGPGPHPAQPRARCRASRKVAGGDRSLGRLDRSLEARAAGARRTTRRKLTFVGGDHRPSAARGRV